MTQAGWAQLEAAAISEKLIKTNRHNISGKDIISGFGMKTKVSTLIDLIRSAMYPNIYGAKYLTARQLPEFVKGNIENAAVLLDCMISEVLVNRCTANARFTSDCDKCREDARQLTMAFLNKLPEIAEILNTDIEAAYNGDPAAISLEEILLSYPGFEAVSIHRLAHELYEFKIPLLPRIMSEQAHAKTGIDIHPGAKIGGHFFIDHGTGVVIGETCIIGSHVKIFQGVTLGAKSFKLDENGNPIKGTKRHPDIEDNVIIYSGATILGGNTVIGHDSIIGGNVWLTQSVPPNSVVYNAAPAPMIKNGD